MVGADDHLIEKIGLSNDRVAHVVCAVNNYGETKHDKLRLRAITARREALHRLRAHGEIGDVSPPPGRA